MIRSFDPQKVLYLLTFFLPFLTVGFFILLLVTIYQSYKIDKEYSAFITGTVTEVYTHKTRSGSFSAMTINYQVGQDSFSITEGISNEKDFNLGDKIELIYDPNMPSLSVPNTFGEVYGPPVFLLLLTVVSSLGSVLLIRRYNRIYVN